MLAGHLPYSKGQPLPPHPQAARELLDQEQLASHPAQLDPPQHFPAVSRRVLQLLQAQLAPQPGPSQPLPAVLRAHRSGTQEWFYNLDARCVTPGLTIGFGVHDSSALFLDAPAELAEQLTANFKRVQVE